MGIFRVLKKSLIIRILALGLLSSGVFACAGASPPAGIPAPVSELMGLSSPDASGVSTLTGAPGAVNGGATVSAANVSQGGMVRLLQGLLIRMAFAQAAPLSAETVAAPDGSFQLRLAAEVGDTIQIIQIVDGESSPPTELTVTDDVIRIGAEPRDLVIDTELNTVLVSTGPIESGDIVLSALTNNGNIYEIDFFGENPTPSLSAPEFSFSDFAGIGPLDLDLNNGRGLAVSDADDELKNFDLALKTTSTFLVSNPLDVSVLQGFDIAGIGVRDPSASIILYDVLLNTSFGCNISIPGIGNHVETPLVKAGFDDFFTPYFVAVSQFDNGDWILSRILFDGGCPAIAGIDQVVLPSNMDPKGLAVFDNFSKAIVTDAANNQVYIGNFIDENFETVGVGSSPQGVAVNDATQMAYVVNQGDNSLSAINLQDLSVQTKSSVGLDPSQIALFPGGNQAAVLSDLSQAVVLVDLNN